MKQVQELKERAVEQLNQKIENQCYNTVEKIVEAIFHKQNEIRNISAEIVELKKRLNEIQPPTKFELE